MEIDVRRSCRSCLCESDAMHPICESAKSEKFDSVEENSFISNMSIAEVIMACTVVNISPDDGLPQSVCSQCLHQIQQAFHFKEKCEAADAKLRQYSLNKTDPIAFVKTENDEMDKLFQPETVLVTEFSTGEEFDDEQTNNVGRLVIKREKIDNKTTIKQFSMDVDEKKLIEQAKIVDGRFQCNFCDKSLADRHTYRLHIRLHTGTNLKRCTICDRGFAKKNHLERHLATHDKTPRTNKAFPTADERKVNESIKVKEEDESKNLPMLVPSQSDTDAPLKNSTTLADSKVGERNETEEESEQDEDSLDPDHKSVKVSTIRQTRRLPLDAEERRLVYSAKIVNDRFECPLCSKSLARRELLVLHIRTHTGKNLLRCSVCAKGFAKPYNLNRHMLLHDSDNDTKFGERMSLAVQPDGSFGCRFCTKTFVERQSFRLHLREHKRNQCDICSQSFGDDEELFEHMSVHGDRFRFPCTECDKVFKTFRERKDHLKTKHTKTKTSKAIKAPNDDDDEDEQLVNSAELVDGRYNCKFCEKTLANRSTLKLHIRLHLQKNLKICQQCGHGFSKNSHLDRHMKTHLPKVPKCKFCNETYDSFTELKLHTDTLHKDEKISESNIPRRPHACDLCSKSFYTEQRLSDHRLRHLPKEKLFACDICDKRFARHDHLRNHMRSHIPPEERPTIEKTHLCSDCGQSFSNSSNLNVHARIHSGERPFKCDICSSSFRRSCDLSCHRRTHTGEKPYPCLVCGHRFSRSNKLVRHMRIHNGERPYKCTECDRAFTQSNDLTLHLRRHTGDKPFNCVCGERFITNSLLKQHQRTHAH